jgi:hypothetical protein
MSRFFDFLCRLLEAIDNWLDVWYAKRALKKGKFTDWEEARKELDL